MFEKIDCTQAQQSQPHDDKVKVVTDFGLIKNNILGIEENNMNRLLQNNTDLFVYFEGKVPVGMMWGHRGSCYIKGPRISIYQNDDVVYLFWIYILPEYRQKGVFTKLKDFFFSYYNGMKGFTAFVSPTNEIMRNQLKKSGFVESKRLLYMNFWNKSFLFDKPLHRESIVRIESENKHNLPVI
jgi:GNAT superfamily N-acetyltransferase